MTTIYVEKEEVGVGIDGRSAYPVRLIFGKNISFGIKAKDAHKLIGVLEEEPNDFLTIESTCGLWTIQFVEKETFGIGGVENQTLMLFTEHGFEELYRLLKLTVPKLQEFIEKNWHELARNQTNDNLRGVFE